MQNKDMKEFNAKDILEENINMKKYKFMNHLNH